MTGITFQFHLVEPHAKQAAFLNSPVKRRVIVAGRRGGKTSACANLAVEKALLGDPPLFLGFVNGVPFFWTLRLLPRMLLLLAVLLPLYYWIDRRASRREGLPLVARGPREPLRLLRVCATSRCCSAS